jgi:hypothetical protein
MHADEHSSRIIGFHLVFCTRQPDSFAAAREKRLAVSGNPAQYDDMRRFVAEQDLFRHLVGESTLPGLELDVSDDDVPGAVERIADWLEERGGLWAIEPQSPEKRPAMEMGKNVASS